MAGAGYFCIWEQFGNRSGSTLETAPGRGYNTSVFGGRGTSVFGSSLVTAPGALWKLLPGGGAIQLHLEGAGYFLVLGSSLGTAPGALWKPLPGDGGTLGARLEGAAFPRADRLEKPGAGPPEPIRKARFQNCPPTVKRKPFRGVRFSYRPGGERRVALGRVGGRGDFCAARAKGKKNKN